jgi:hypothetical protein
MIKQVCNSDQAYQNQQNHEVVAYILPHPENHRETHSECQADEDAARERAIARNKRMIAGLTTGLKVSS